MAGFVMPRAYDAFPAASIPPSAASGRSVARSTHTCHVAMLLRIMRTQILGLALPVLLRSWRLRHAAAGSHNRLARPDAAPPETGADRAPRGFGRTAGGNAGGLQARAGGRRGLHRAGSGDDQGPRARGAPRHLSFGHDRHCRSPGVRRPQASVERRRVPQPGGLVGRRFHAGRIEDAAREAGLPRTLEGL